MAIDAQDRTAVTKALDGVRFLVNCATAKTIPPLVKCAMEAGVDWIDVQFSPDEAQIIRSYDDEAKQRGVCIVTQGGFHPGIPACLVRCAASEMDTMTSGWVGSVIRPEGGLKFSDGIDELMELLREYRSHEYIEGEWRTAGMTDRFDFGKPFGRRRAFAMDLDEMQALTPLLPDLRNIGFYVAAVHPVLDFVLVPLLMLGLKIAPRRGIRPLGRLYCRAYEAFSRPPYGTLLQLDAEGTKNSQPCRYQLRLFHGDEYDMTAIPVAVMIRQLLEERPAGVHLMAILADPKRMIEGCQEMGVDVKCRVTPAYSSPRHP
jgi:saccharopine dehydrogenase (NAD+, L-lysine-forming)